jgi:hypothetical protein
MQADNVRLSQQNIERNITRSGLQKIGCWRSRIKRQQRHAETCHDAAEYPPDYACADYAKRLAVQVETQQAVERKITVASPGISTMQLAIQRQDQPGGVLLTIFLLGAVVTILPLVLTMLFGRYVLGYTNAALLAGALTGSRSANPAFGGVLDKAESAVPTVPFAITYALANVLLTLLGPLVVGLV